LYWPRIILKYVRARASRKAAKPQRAQGNIKEEDEDERTIEQERTQRGKAATKFWILDFRFWIEE
jgi:hypothetical protein